MSSEESDFNDDHKYTNKPQLGSNGSLSEELDNDFSAYYESFVMDSNTWFVCRYKDCEQTERHLNEMIRHLRHHFSEDNVTSNVNLGDNELIVPNDDSMDGKDNKVVIDLNISSNSDSTNGQKGGRVDLKYIEPEVELHNKGAIGVNDNQSNNDFMNWAKETRINGKQMLRCLWTDCQYNTSLKIKFKQHLNKHFCHKSTENQNKVLTESEFWNEIFPESGHNVEDNGHSATPLVESTPRRKSSRKTSKQSNVTPIANYNSTEYYLPPEMPNTSESAINANNVTKVSELIDVNIGHNAVLSLKGMASARKLKDYIDRRVINNEKVYFCKMCPRKSRRTQEMAAHIHTAHIGMYLKCIQPNCGKVFRTPNSWREHQKNHICNFGIWGYQRGVFGPCRNENLYKYREVVIRNGNQKGYRCKWPQCQFITGRNQGLKRHIHNQHCCPWRNSTAWKERFNESLQYSQQIPDIPIDAIVSQNDLPKISGQAFSCRRTQCKAKFANEADLKKHENLLCRYRQSAKNERMKDKQKSVPKSSHFMQTTENSNEFPKQSKRLTKNSNQSQETERKMCPKIETKIEFISKPNLNESDIKTKDHSIESRIGPQLKSKCDKYIELKECDGVQYHLCRYLDCKFVAKGANRIYDHILRSHLGSNRTPNHELNRIPEQSSSHKRSRSSIEVDIIEPKAKRVRNYANDLQKTTPKMTIEVLDNKPNEPQEECDLYIKEGSIASETQFFCKYNDCKYYSRKLSETRNHFNETHRQYKCNVKDCNKTFKNDNHLKVHKRNHLCSFMISGQQSSGVCAVNNIVKYAVEKFEQHLDKTVFSCRYVNCDFQSTSRSQSIQHIHNRHICPNKDLSPKQVNIDLRLRELV